MRANLLAWEMFVALSVGLVATPRNAVAQSRGDTIAVLQTLTTKFAAHDHGRIYLYSHMGDSKHYMERSEPDHQNQRKLIAMAAQGNPAVDVYEQLPRSASPEAAQLRKHLALDFRAGYRIMSLAFSGAAASAEVSRETFTYTPEKTTFSVSRLRYDLLMTDGKWNVANVRLLEVDSGWLDQ